MLSVNEASISFMLIFSFFFFKLSGLKERCVDLLVFESLIPKPMLQHYVSLLLKHRRLLLSGPSGTGKSFLAHRLAEYLVERSGRDITDGIVTACNMHQQSCKVSETIITCNNYTILFTLSLGSYYQAPNLKSSLAPRSHGLCNTIK